MSDYEEKHGWDDLSDEVEEDAEEPTRDELNRKLVDWLRPGGLQHDWPDYSPYDLGNCSRCSLLPSSPELEGRCYPRLDTWDGLRLLLEAMKTKYIRFDTEWGIEGGWQAWWWDNDCGYWTARGESLEEAAFLVTVKAMEVDKELRHPTLRIGRFMVRWLGRDGGWWFQTWRWKWAPSTRLITMGLGPIAFYAGDSPGTIKAGADYEGRQSG